MSGLFKVRSELLKLQEDLSHTCVLTLLMCGGEEL